jgi:hypothetical protein
MSTRMNAGVAAFRAGNAPHILQVFEFGTATMMAALLCPARPPMGRLFGCTETVSKNRQREPLICKGLLIAEIAYRKQLIVVLAWPMMHSSNGAMP